MINVDKLTYAGNPLSLADLASRFPQRYVFRKADICDRAAMGADCAISRVQNFVGSRRIDVG